MADPNELKDFQDLYKSLEAQNKKTPEYEAFLTSIKAVNDKMSVMYNKDNYGRIPLVKQADKEAFLNLHKDLGEKAENFLKAPGNMSKEAVDTVKKLSGLNTAFFNTMSAYDPTRAKALHTIHEQARTPVIDTRNRQLKAQLGGSVNKRQPLTFLEPSGKEITGVFIPEKIENGAEKIREGIASAQKKAATQTGAELLGKMRDHFHNKRKDPQNKDLAGDLYQFGYMQVRGSHPPKFTAKSISNYINKNMHYDLKGGTVQNTIGNAALQELANNLTQYYHSMSMNLGDAKMLPGSRTDNRNAAMSSVAELLGVPEVVARAKPMTIIDSTGKEVNGTFMMAAEGVDPANVPKEASKIGLSAAKGTDGKAFKQIADLQVLDYICGNIDRHANNFFCKFDKKGKLIGIQGIDNDCSFGLVVPENGKGHNQLVGLKNMRVISESMYNKLKDMTPEQLKFSLRGYGLSEKEMDAAVERVEQIKTAVEKDKEYFKSTGKTKPEDGKILIVPDNQFKKMKLQDMCALERDRNGYQKSANLFAHVEGNLIEMNKLYNEQKAQRLKDKKEWETLKSEVAIGEENRANPGSVRKMGEKADKLYKEMDKRTNPWKLFWKSSPAYEKMQKAMKDYTTYKKQLLDRLELAQDPNYTGKPKNAGRNFDKEAVISKEDLEKLQKLGQAVYDTSTAYTEGKAGIDMDHAKPYVKNRYEIGIASKQFGEQAKKALTEEEFKTLAKNEKLAEENEARTKGNQKEAEERKNAGPVPN